MFGAERCRRGIIQILWGFSPGRSLVLKLQSYHVLSETHISRPVQVIQVWCPFRSGDINICRDWKNFGACKYNADCAFAHVKQKTLENFGYLVESDFVRGQWKPTPDVKASTEVSTRDEDVVLPSPVYGASAVYGPPQRAGAARRDPVGVSDGGEEEVKVRRVEVVPAVEEPVVASAVPSEPAVEEPQVVVAGGREGGVGGEERKEVVVGDDGFVDAEEPVFGDNPFGCAGASDEDDVLVKLDEDEDLYGEL